MKESNVVHIAAPVTVVGDIHGQFFDMIEIFKIGGFCPDTNYLFLGGLLPRVFACSALTFYSVQATTSIEASSPSRPSPSSSASNCATHRACTSSEATTRAEA